jgi:hypothetical protein
MDDEPGHPNVAPSDWEAFRKGFSPFSFAEVIDRSELDLPDWFVPLARGVAIHMTFPPSSISANVPAEKLCPPASAACLYVRNRGVRQPCLRASHNRITLHPE